MPLTQKELGSSLPKISYCNEILFQNWPFFWRKTISIHFPLSPVENKEQMW